MDEPLDESVPQDAQGGVGGAIDDHERAGFTSHFQARAEGRIKCLSCDHDFPAGDVTVFDETRVEGASDPGDLGIVIALTCPRCSVAGTLAARFGPEASAEEAEVLRELAQNRR